jgi:hypothetical protein
MMALVRSFIVWFALIGAEVIHGAARAIWLVPIVGDFRSRQIGVFTGSMINLTVTALFIRWLRPARVADALLIGVTWLLLTVTFELVFGRAIMQASWQRIGSDYDLIHGGLLPLGLLILTLAPVITAKVRRLL